jgi:hypothetical protein
MTDFGACSVIASRLSSAMGFTRLAGQQGNIAINPATEKLLWQYAKCDLEYCLDLIANLMYSNWRVEIVAYTCQKRHQ